jgi:hypothetical protein
MGTRETQARDPNCWRGWNDEGLLVGQLNGTNEGIIIFDTETQALFKKTIEKEGE